MNNKLNPKFEAPYIKQYVRINGLSIDSLGNFHNFMLMRSCNYLIKLISKYIFFLSTLILMGVNTLKSSFLKIR